MRNTTAKSTLSVNVHVPMRLITADGVPPMDAVKTLWALADALEGIA